MKQGRGRCASQIRRRSGGCIKFFKFQVNSLESPFLPSPLEAENLAFDVAQADLEPVEGWKPGTPRSAVFRSFAIRPFTQSSLHKRQPIRCRVILRPLEVQRTA